MESQFVYDSEGEEDDGLDHIVYRLDSVSDKSGGRDELPQPHLSFSADEAVFASLSGISGDGYQNPSDILLQALLAQAKPQGGIVCPVVGDVDCPANFGALATDYDAAAVGRAFSSDASCVAHDRSSHSGNEIRSVLPDLAHVGSVDSVAKDPVSVGAVWAATARLAMARPNPAPSLNASSQVLGHAPNPLATGSVARSSTLDDDEMLWFTDNNARTTSPLSTAAGSGRGGARKRSAQQGKGWGWPALSSPPHAAPPQNQVPSKPPAAAKLLASIHMRAAAATAAGSVLADRSGRAYVGGDTSGPCSPRGHGQLPANSPPPSPQQPRASAHSAAFFQMASSASSAPTSGGGPPGSSSSVAHLLRGVPGVSAAAGESTQARAWDAADKRGPLSSPPPRRLAVASAVTPIVVARSFSHTPSHGVAVSMPETVAPAVTVQELSATAMQIATIGGKNDSIRQQRPLPSPPTLTAVAAAAARAIHLPHRRFQDKVGLISLLPQPVVSSEGMPAHGMNNVGDIVEDESLPASGQVNKEHLRDAASPDFLRAAGRPLFQLPNKPDCVDVVDEILDSLIVLREGEGGHCNLAGGNIMHESDLPSTDVAHALAGDLDPSYHFLLAAPVSTTSAAVASVCHAEIPAASLHPVASSTKLDSGGVGSDRPDAGAVTSTRHSATWGMTPNLMSVPVPGGLLAALLQVRRSAVHDATMLRHAQMQQQQQRQRVLEEGSSATRAPGMADVAADMHKDDPMPSQAASNNTSGVQMLGGMKPEQPPATPQAARGKAVEEGASGRLFFASPASVLSAAAGAPTVAAAASALLAGLKRRPVPSSSSSAPHLSSIGNRSMKPTAAHVVAREGGHGSKMLTSMTDPRARRSWVEVAVAFPPPQQQQLPALPEVALVKIYARVTALSGEVAPAAAECGVAVISSDDRSAFEIRGQARGLRSRCCAQCPPLSSTISVQNAYEAGFCRLLRCGQTPPLPLDTDIVSSISPGDCIAMFLSATQWNELLATAAASVDANSSSTGTDTGVSKKARGSTSANEHKQQCADLGLSAPVNKEVIFHLRVFQPFSLLSVMHDGPLCSTAPVPLLSTTTHPCCWLVGARLLDISLQCLSI